MLSEEIRGKDITESPNCKVINIIWNSTKRILVVEDSIKDIIKSFNTKEKTLESFISYIYKDDKEKMLEFFNQDFEKMYSENKKMKLQYRIKDDYGRVQEILLLSTIIKNNQDFILAGVNYLLLSINNDYQNIKDWNREWNMIIDSPNINYSILYDNVTKLPDSHNFEYIVSKLLMNKKDKTVRSALMVLDIDNFKYVNDSFGHKFGDLVLKKIGSRILKILPEDCVFCRYSADVFLIYKDSVKDVSELMKLSEKISSVLDEPSIIGDNVIYLSVSTGIAMCPDNGINYVTLLKNADAAMHEAKSDGKRECKCFDYAFEDELNKIYELQKGLRTALENDEIYVVFQPKVSLGDSLVSGFEALARWKSSRFGEVSPAEFIPIAENSKMIIPIGSFILEEVFKKVRILLNEGKDNFKIAVNLSEIQLREDAVVCQLKRLFKKYKIPPRYIEVEITESILMKSFDKNLNILREIKDLGVTIALDDFGTGYSSLNYLTKLPIDVLKIDRSFVIDIMNNPKSKCIVENIIDLSHKLGIEVVAEGVEDKDQVDYLKLSFCDLVQGYYYSKPRAFRQIINIIGKKILKSD